VRITRRTSGGRGEYEISEETLAGVTPADLAGSELVLDIGGQLTIYTATQLRHTQGKFRVRMLPECEIHLHRQLAASLLMPESVRADEALGAGSPVLLRGRYAIDHIEIADARRDGARATLRVSEVVVRNRSHLAEELGLAHRLTSLKDVWEHSDAFPQSIFRLLATHAHIVTSGGPIPNEGEKLVAQLQADLSEQASDLGILYSEHTDVLPALVELLELDVPEPVLRVEDIDPEELDLKRRTIKEWKRWATSRGPASARFRNNVRAAYNSTCLVCGKHLPSTSISKAPGVDAAHILPWSDYDLDRTDNGLCLCKLHHWAFDEGLIDIVHRDGQYYVEMPPHVRAQISAENPEFSLDAFDQVTGPIQPARLPASSNDWPNTEFLNLLREARGV